VSIALRVAARFLFADLNPPLGVPGGPCSVVDRIKHDVRNERTRDHLVDEVESNDALTNPEAHAVYDMEQEPARGIARRLLISPHAQYRMDLRRVTVPDVLGALASFSKLYFGFKSQKGPAYQSMDRELRSGKPYRWTDPKTDLTIVFLPTGADQVTLVTTYWAGKDTPKIKPGQCP
jgi:hypothetical protein